MGPKFVFRLVTTQACAELSRERSYTKQQRCTNPARHEKSRPLVADFGSVQGRDVKRSVIRSGSYLVEVASG